MGNRDPGMQSVSRNTDQHDFAAPEIGLPNGEAGKLWQRIVI